MTSIEKRPKSFTSLFYYVLTIDLLVFIAIASKDDVWSHLAMMWTGPLDDIFYALLGVKAFFYLTDPSSEALTDSKDESFLSQFRDLISKGWGFEKSFAREFLVGSAKALILLPAVLVIALIANFTTDHTIIEGTANFFGRHLSLIFPVCTVMGLGFTFLKLIPDNSSFWRGALVASLGLFCVALSDGRWENHIFHLFNNLESLQAWFISFAWAAFFSARVAANENLQPLTEQS